MEYDPKSGRIRLVGHFDPEYRISAIPYFDYLATLLDGPSPEFSLNWTRESVVRIADLRRRLESDDEWRRLAREWGRWFDDNGYVTPAGRYFMPLMGVKLPAGNAGASLKMDPYQRAAALVAATGNENGARILQAYSQLNHAMPHATFSDLRPLLRVTGTLEVFNSVNEQVIQGNLTKDQAMIQLWRKLLGSMDEAFEFGDSPSLRAFNITLQHTGSSDAGWDAGLKEFDRHILQYYKQVLTRIWDTAPPEMHVPVTLIDPALRVLNVEPTYRGVDRRSLLARLLFEADYIGKRLEDIEELAGTIPGYQTEYAFRLANPSVGLSRRTRNARVWISVDRVDATRSTDGNILAFGGVAMRINIREMDQNDRDLPNQQPGAYEKLLTSLYDDFARQYSPVFHELRETAKLAYAARWLKARNRNLALPGQGRATWSSPAQVPGIIYITWSPHPSRPDVQTTSAIGGVRIAVPQPGPEVCVYPSPCDQNIPSNNQVKPIEGTPALRIGPPGGSPAEAYVKLNGSLTIDNGPRNPIRTRQLPSVTCLAAAAAGLPGLGVLTDRIDDDNTRAVAVLNSAFDGSAAFDPDCDAKIAKLSREDRQKVDAAKPLVERGIAAKTKQLTDAAKIARKEYDDANREYQKAGECVKAAAAKQRQLHEPGEFMRRTSGEFIAEVRSTGERLVDCNNEVLQQAGKVFKAKDKVQQACASLTGIVTLGGQPISEEQLETCKVDK